MNSTPSERQSSTGVIQGRYKIIKELGHGGFGHVYLADDMLLQRKVAMKFLSGFGDTFRALTEVTLLASLPPHPNICSYQRTLTVHGAPVIVMPYAEQGSLAEVAPNLSSAPSSLVALALQAAAGLSQIHAFELIHGDVKPHNLLLFAEGRLAVADFGVSMHISAAQDGRLGGTEAYLPQNGDDFIRYGRGTDWYAFSLTFIEAFLGYRPWKRGGDAWASLNKIGALHRSDVGRFIRCLAQILQVSPSDREQAAQGLIGELKNLYYEEIGTSALEAPPLIQKPKEVSDYVPGLHRVDLAGPVWGPEILLMRVLGAVYRAGLDSNSLESIKNDESVPANRESSLAASIVTFGRIIDTLTMMNSSILVPYIADAWSEMGFAYSYLGDLTGAVQAQIEALSVLSSVSMIENDDDFNLKTVGIALRLADALSELGSYQEARTTLESVLDRATTVSAEFELKISLANIDSDLGRYDSAVQVYSELIVRLDREEHASQLGRLHFERGRSLARLHRLDEAEADLKLAAEISLSILMHSPQHPMYLTVRRVFPSVLAMLATVHTDQGSHAEAVRIYGLAIENYEYNRDVMLESELEDSLASTELSLSFSLEALGDAFACDNVLSKCIDRRRRLLASGHDASAIGLANSLFALTRRRMSAGDHLEARSSAMECLRLAAMLETIGSRYIVHVHEIALQCLGFIFDRDHDLDSDTQERTLLWMIGELDALRNISGSAADQATRATQRAAILFNLVGYVTEERMQALLLNEAAQIASEAGELNGVDTLLLSEILVKSAAVKYGLNDHAGAIEAARRAVELARKLIRSHKVDGTLTAAYDLMLAKSLMTMAASLAHEGRHSTRADEPTGDERAASEALVILRELSDSDLDARQCTDAAVELFAAPNFLRLDPRRSASDGALGFKLIVRALQKDPSVNRLQMVSEMAQWAMARYLKCDDRHGAEDIIGEVQELATTVRFPNTIREAALSLISELATHLANRLHGA